MKRESIDVIFRVYTDPAGFGPLFDVTAVFPSLPGTNSPGTALCYAHLGQHGSCSRSWYSMTRPATRKEYAPLLRELRGIYGRALHPGDTVYRLNVVKRWTRKHDSARFMAACGVQS